MNKVTTAIIGSTMMLLAACQEDPNDAANALMVQMIAAQKEAAALSATASKEAATQKIALLEGILASSKKVLEEYPQSDLAVDLSADGNANGIDIAGVADDLGRAKSDLECFADALKCVVALYEENLEPMLSSVRRDRDASFYADYGLSVLASHYSADGRTDDAKAVIERIDEPQFRFSAFIDAGLIANAERERQQENMDQAADVAIGFLMGGVTETADYYAKLVEQASTPASEYGKKFGPLEAAAHLRVLYVREDTDKAEAFLDELVPAMAAEKANPTHYLYVLDQVPIETAKPRFGIALDATKELQFDGFREGFALICIAHVAERPGVVEGLENRLLSEQAVADSASLPRAPDHIVNGVVYGLQEIFACPSKVPGAEELALAVAEAIKATRPAQSVELLLKSGQKEQALALALDGMRKTVAMNNFGKEYNQFFASVISSSAN